MEPLRISHGGEKAAQTAFSGCEDRFLNMRGTSAAAEVPLSLSKKSAKRQTFSYKDDKIESKG